MQKSWVIFFLFFATSCNLFYTKETDKDNIVAAEVKSINWLDVDRYPMFEDCDETDEKIFQRECFESILVSHINSCMNKAELETDEDLHAVIKVDFKINRFGEISVVAIEEHDEINRLLPNIHDLLKDCIYKLPKVAPALKRSIPVDTQFRIPVIFNVQ